MTEVIHNQYFFQWKKSFLTAYLLIYTIVDFNPHWRVELGNVTNVKGFIHFFIRYFKNFWKTFAGKPRSNFIYIFKKIPFFESKVFDNVSFLTGFFSKLPPLKKTIPACIILKRMNKIFLSKSIFLYRKSSIVFNSVYLKLKSCRGIEFKNEYGHPCKN